MADYTQILKQIALLGQKRVYVGIPANSPERVATTLVEHEKISNAALGYIHETGSPARNIPSRAFLRPGVANSRNQWLPKIDAAGQKAMAGEDFMKELQAAGTIAARAVQKRIQAGIPPPLKPATVAARRRRSKGSKYRRKATTAAQTTPLIDTGQLLKSITWVIR